MELKNKCKNCVNETLWTIVIDHIEQAGVFRTVILTASVTIVAGLITFGIGYGELRGQVKSLSEQLNRIERSIPYVEKGH